VEPALRGRLSERERKTLNGVKENAGASDRGRRREDTEARTKKEIIRIRNVASDEQGGKERKKAEIISTEDKTDRTRSSLTLKEEIDDLSRESKTGGERSW